MTRGAILRGFGLVVGAVLLAAITIRQGITAASTSRNPAVAMQMSPSNARAIEQHLENRLTTSNQMLQGGEVETLARRALARDATSVRAARSLALVFETRDDSARADGLIAYSAKLSRRDLGTQLFLIERAVERDDAIAALGHMDIALRSRQRSFPLLFPILANALADPFFIEPMARIAADNPAWFRFFVGYAMSDGPTPTNLAKLLASVPDSEISRDREVSRQLLDRLMRDRAYSAAFDHYRSIRGTSNDLLRDGEFARQSNLAPFEWQYAADGHVSAQPAAGDVAMAYQVRGTRGGMLVQQALILDPGRYVLSSSARSTDRNGPVWRVTCLEDAREIARLTMRRSATRPQAATVEFVVPSGCVAQKLSYEALGSFGPDGISGQVDYVNVRRRST